MSSGGTRTTRKKHGTDRRKAGRRRTRKPRSSSINLRELPLIRPTGPPEGDTDPHRLARFYMRRCRTDEHDRLTLYYWGGGWWAYDEGRYRLLEPDELQKDLMTAIKLEFDRRPVVDRYGRVRRVTPFLCRNVEASAQSLGRVFRSGPVKTRAWLGKGEEREFIALRNGLLNFDRVRSGNPIHHLRPHTPEWFTASCLPYDFDPKAICPEWQAFLHWMFDGDQERLNFVQEWFGYCLVPDTSLQVFLMVEGPGANGKSVMLSVLEALVGTENCSAVSLEDFQGEFALAATIGKLVNIVAEVGDVHRLPEGKLKGFVVGDLMSINRKYRDALQVNPTARLVFATNNLPPFRDRSDGIWRRLIVLPATQVVPVAEQDRDLPEKLKGELPGIFNWALEGLKRLRDRDRFEMPQRCQAALQVHRGECDPTRTFLRECFVEDPQGRVESTTLYKAYGAWCQETSAPVESPAELGKALKRVFPRVTTRRLGSREQRSSVYVGVRGVRAPWVVGESDRSGIGKEMNKGEALDAPDTAASATPRPSALPEPDERGGTGRR